MGGEAAKERRRLKRLAAAAQKNDAAELAPAQVKKDNTKEGGQGNIAQLRLQRKIARKAKGTFKPLEGKSPPQVRKRNVEESSNRTPVKKFKGGNKHSSSKKNNVRKNSATEGKAQATKKTKPKKPKHLKRKMEQLTKAMSSGGSGEGEESTVEQLEQQMQELAKQMEEFKKIKRIKSEKSENKPSTKAKVVSDENTETAQSKAPDADSISDAHRVHSSEKENEIKRTPSSSAVDEDSSDDDEDDIVEQVNTRSRGKRRRGRRENSSEKHGDEPEENKVTKDVTSQAAEKDQLEENLSTVEGTKTSAEEVQSSTAPSVTDDDTKQSKKTPKKDDKRRCIGRKPVTDFEINKCYNGKVQYIKPRLGAFIDIGCHSDAFIHISCISDSYITSVEEVLKVGDEVKNLRVVEIDREKKRITLSLRSEDHDAVKSQKETVATDAASEAVEQKEETSSASKSKEPLPVANSFSNNQVTEDKAFPVSSAQKTSAQKTGADLKRERKLARRAARRAMQNNNDA